MLSEKEAAKRAGIRPALLRYYRETGMLTCSEVSLYDDTVSQQVRNIELLLGIGFRETEVAQMQKTPGEIPSVCRQVGKRCGGGVALRYYLQNGEGAVYPSAVPALAEKLSALAAENGKKEKKQMRSDRTSVRILGGCAYAAVCLLLMGEAAAAYWLRGSLWQAVVYPIPLVILFFGVDWMRLLTAAVTFLDVGALALMWDRLGAEAVTNGSFLPLLGSILMIATADILLLLSKNLQSFLYRRHHK